MIVMIGIPTHDSVKARTAVSLAAAVRLLPDEVIVHLITMMGFNILENRQKIVLEALAVQADYVLFVDSDMAFDPEGITTLLGHQKAIVGAHYNIRNAYPLMPVEMVRRNGQLEHLTEMPEELFRCQAVGFGLTLIQTAVFQRMEQPWFWFEREPDGRFGCEAAYFCQRAEKAGFEIWCDPTIKTVHIGEYGY